MGVVVNDNKIHDITLQNPVDKVAQGTPQYKCQCKSHQFLCMSYPNHPDGDTNTHGTGNHHQEPTLPAASVVQETERSTRVMQHSELEDRQYFNGNTSPRFTEWQYVAHIPLGYLIQQDQYCCNKVIDHFPAPIKKVCAFSISLNIAAFNSSSPENFFSSRILCKNRT